MRLLPTYSTRAQGRAQERLALEQVFGLLKE